MGKRVTPEFENGIIPIKENLDRVGNRLPYTIVPGPEFSYNFKTRRNSTKEVNLKRALQATVVMTDDGESAE